MKFGLLFFLFLILGLLYFNSSKEIKHTLRQKEKLSTKSENDTFCNIDFLGIRENEQVEINCQYDLTGQSFRLPSNVKIKYAGGALTGGELIFTHNGKIDGELLNLGLKISGDITLSKRKYILNPDLWEIKQGVVSNFIALKNRRYFNLAVERAKELGANIFEINNSFDAYFNVEAKPLDHSLKQVNIAIHQNSLKIPSNIHLKMSDKVHLRTQPNNSPYYALISSYGTQNIKITGGHLWGDRYAHSYKNFKENSKLNTHEWGRVVSMMGTYNVLIENVEIKDSTGDGYHQSHLFMRDRNGRLVDENKTTKKVIIQKCSLINNRRSNINIIDGRDIVVKDNIIRDAGVDGVYPQSGISLRMEDHETRNDYIMELQEVENIRITDNKFYGSKNIDIVFSRASNSIVENNIFTNSIYLRESHHVSIKKNIFRGTGISFDTAISVVSDDPRDKNNRLNHSNNISHNKIYNFTHGITVDGENHLLDENEVIDAHLGILLLSCNESEFIGNKIISQIKHSQGYSVSDSGMQARSIIIKRGEVKVDGSPLFLTGVRSYDGFEGENTIIIDGVLFSSRDKEPVSVTGSQNVIIENSFSSGGFKQEDSENVLFLENKQGKMAFNQ